TYLPSGTTVSRIAGGNVTVSNNAGTTIAPGTQVLFLGGGTFLGGGRFGANYNDNTHYVNFATATAGASSITLDCTGKPAQCTTNKANCSALFHNGDWALTTALDMQGYGFPSNPRIYEWIQISTVNCGAGVITFKTPLKYSYDSTLPNYNQG